MHEKRADFRQSAFRHTVTVYTNTDKAKILSDVDKRPCDQTKEKKTEISFKVTNVHNKNIYVNHPSMLNRSRQVHTAEMNKKSDTSFKMCNEYIQCKHIGTDVDKTCI